MVVVALARLSCSDSAVVVLSSSFPAYGPGPVLPGVAVVLTVPFSVLSFYLAFSLRYPIDISPLLHLPLVLTVSSPSSCLFLVWPTLSLALTAFQLSSLSFSFSVISSNNWSNSYICFDVPLPVLSFLFVSLYCACKRATPSLTDLCFTLNFNSLQLSSDLAISDHISTLSGLPYLNWKGYLHSISLHSITSWSSLHSIAALQ